MRCGQIAGRNSWDRYPLYHVSVWNLYSIASHGVSAFYFIWHSVYSGWKILLEIDHSVHPNDQQQKEKNIMIVLDLGAFSQYEMLLFCNISVQNFALAAKFVKQRSN